MDNINGLEQEIDRLVRVPLTKNQRSALISFVYNVRDHSL